MVQSVLPTSKPNVVIHHAFIWQVGVNLCRLKGVDRRVFLFAGRMGHKEAQRHLAMPCSHLPDRGPGRQPFMCKTKLTPDPRVQAFGKPNT